MSHPHRIPLQGSEASPTAVRPSGQCAARSTTWACMCCMHARGRLAEMQHGTRADGHPLNCACGKPPQTIRLLSDPPSIAPIAHNPTRSADELLLQQQHRCLLISSPPLPCIRWRISFSECACPVASSWVHSASGICPTPSAAFSAVRYRPASYRGQTLRRIGRGSLVQCSMPPVRLSSRCSNRLRAPPARWRCPPQQAFPPQTRQNLLRPQAPLRRHP